MVGNATLGEVISSDTIAAISRANQRFTGLSFELVLLACSLHLELSLGHLQLAVATLHGLGCGLVLLVGLGLLFGRGDLRELQGGLAGGDEPGVLGVVGRAGLLGGGGDEVRVDADGEEHGGEGGLGVGEDAGQGGGEGLIPAVGQGPAGPAGPAGSVSDYRHTQASASAVWTINHNLARDVSVTLYTPGGVEFDAEIVQTSPNQCLALLAAPSCKTSAPETLLTMEPEVTELEEKFAPTPVVREL